MYNIIIAIKKIYSLFVLSFLFSLLIIINSYSSEKIGTVVNLKNEVIAINVDGEKRLLDLYDEILLKDKIMTHYHYIPNTNFKYYKGKNYSDFQGTLNHLKNAVSLPIYYKLSLNELKRVEKKIKFIVDQYTL